MKKFVFYFTTMFLVVSTNAQTNLIVNGGFENSPNFANWSHVIADGNLWGGSISTCTAHGGSKYVWLGDQNQQTGVNLETDDIYQTVTIPSNITTCTLYFWTSINTLETSSTVSDYMNINIRSTTGALLLSLGQIGNDKANTGIPGCQPWSEWSVNIPSNYFGSTVRISFEFSTDFSKPTIFRLDDVSLIAGSNVGINEIKDNQFSIYPNPAQNEITIESKQQMIGEDFEIVNILGSTVAKGQIKDLNTTVNLESLNAGIYLLRINSNGYTIKFIKK